MTVGTLMEYLEDYPEDAEVVIKASNSMYVDNIYDVNEKELRSFYGDDHDVVVLEADSQLGAV